MRLGEFRTKTKNLDNHYIIRMSNYDDGTVYDDLEIDIINNEAIYLRKPEPPINIKFTLKWTKPIPELLEQFQKAETEDELLKLLQDNMELEII